MKIYVYAICKNEAQFVQRWMHSMREADDVYVLDTGSNDETVPLLQQAGAHVTVEKIEPWRFDTARNRSLELVPDDADLLVCTDLDEIFEEGWRAKLEAAAQQSGATQLRYRYVWSHTEKGGEGIVFWADKVHKPRLYVWAHPVHEVLVPSAQDGIERKQAYAYGVQLDHLPDQTKSRGQYLGLLELSVQEDPEDDRNMHYLGREYMFVGKWQAAIDTLKRHLQLPRAVWNEERAASMRFLSRCYLNLNNAAEAAAWSLRAIAEAPDTREPYIDYALLCHSSADWAGILWSCEKALAITARSFSYINEPAAWGPLPHDLLSIAYYHYGLFHKAVQQADAALAFGYDERVAQNRSLFAENI